MPWLWSALLVVACGISFVMGLLTGFAIDAWCAMRASDGQARDVTRR